MDIAGLPSDILVEVTASIATRSPTPLVDIVNLRRSCKVFRDATVARKVGRCMAVHTVAEPGLYSWMDVRSSPHRPLVAGLDSRIGCRNG
ncbi:unnamed protein product [Urochloa humidicola]